MKFKATIIGDPVRDLTLCLLGGGKLKPEEITLPGLQHTSGYKYGDTFDIYVEGRRRPLCFDQMADDFNPLNPYQFVKVIGNNQSYREFAHMVYEETSMLGAIVVQNFDRENKRFPSKLYYGSTDPANKVNDWGFHWVNLTFPQKLYDDSQSRVELNLKATPDIVMAIDVPAGAFFSVTFFINQA